VGRRRLTDSDLEFRAEIARKFDQARKDRDLNQSAAARALGITRQAFSQYLLRKATPQATVLARACTIWNLKLRYRGQEFTNAAFAKVDAAPSVDASAFQIELFDRPQHIENNRFLVILERAARSTLQVTIKMKKSTLSGNVHRLHAGPLPRKRTSHD
jgi:transcriptional regulator with XRE-family HTH domain